MKLKKIKTFVVSMILAGAVAVPAFAETGWQSQDNTWYYYDEAGNVQTGWRQIDGKWYYFDESGVMQTGWIQDADDNLWYNLDAESGAWVKRPAINETSVKYLLENAIKKAGYYQNEADPVEIAVTWQDGANIYASVRMVTGPNSYTDLNTYTVSKRTGFAQGPRGTGLDLYQ